MMNQQTKKVEPDIQDKAESKPEPKKPYATPELTVHGKLERLTAGSGYGTIS